MMPGRARSPSVIASPQVGQATQAIDQRRTVEISSSSLTPCSRRICSSLARLPGCRAVTVMLFDLGVKLGHTPVVDQVLESGRLAVRAVAKVALHQDDRRGHFDRL